MGSASVANNINSREEDGRGSATSQQHQRPRRGGTGARPRVKINMPTLLSLLFSYQIGTTFVVVDAYIHAGIKIILDMVLMKHIHI